MALDKSGLKSDLEAWMNDKDNYSTSDESWQVFIDAYENYALNAADVTMDTVNTVMKSAALNILKLIVQPGTAVNAATQIELAIIAFWTGATFKILTPPPGSMLPEIAVVAPPPPGPLMSALLAVFSNLTDNVTTKAGQLADALDAATKTVVVTCTGTPIPPSVVPVVLAGPIS